VRLHHEAINFDVLLINIGNALRKKDLERQLEDYRANLEIKVGSRPILSISALSTRR